jgi:hypothetical protein
MVLDSAEGFVSAGGGGAQQTGLPGPAGDAPEGPGGASGKAEGRRGPDTQGQRGNEALTHCEYYVFSVDVRIVRRSASCRPKAPV